MRLFIIWCDILCMIDPVVYVYSHLTKRTPSTLKLHFRGFRHWSARHCQLVRWLLNIEFSKLRFFKLMVAFRAGRCGFYSCSWHLLDQNTHRWKLHDQSKQWYTQCTVYPSSRFDHVICKYLSRSPSSSSNYNPTEDD